MTIYHLLQTWFFFFNHGSITPKEDETFAFKKKKKKKDERFSGNENLSSFIYLFIFSLVEPKFAISSLIFFFFNECMKLVVLANRELLEII